MPTFLKTCEIYPVRNATNVASISARDSHVLALTKNGQVLSWGSNQYSEGVLGREPTAEFPADVAAEVTGLAQITAVATGFNTSFALKRDGTVWVWGSNGDGLFANGDRRERPARLTPEPIAGLAGVVAIAASGGRQAIVLLKDGTLRAWGNSDFGQVGGGAGNFVERPVQLKIASVKTVFAVGNNAYAIKTDNAVWGWGPGHPGDYPFVRNARAPVPVDLK